MCAHITGIGAYTPRRMNPTPRRCVGLLQRKRTRPSSAVQHQILSEPRLSELEAAETLSLRHPRLVRLEKLRSNSSLLGLPSGYSVVYPKFQFDRQHACIHETVIRVNTLLDAAADPWGAAVWWMSHHVGLGARPCDFVTGGASHLRVEDWKSVLVAAANDAMGVDV